MRFPNFTSGVLDAGGQSRPGSWTSWQMAACLLIALLPFSARSPLWGQAESVDFFESRIRPVLIEYCYECHNSTELSEGDLALDWRTPTRKASASGTAVVPGDPDASLLLRAIRHEIEGMEMPAGGEQLPAEVIQDFEKWIAAGAPDPRDSPPAGDTTAAEISWQAKLEKRKQWWSFQPISDSAPPDPFFGSDHPVDRFVHQGLQKAGLTPAPPADRSSLLRRLSLVLTGLPPTPAEVEQFLNDPAPNAFERQVDRLLSSPHFGERWARHWMDLVRYADSHGSEGDPPIPHAWQYRDYLIRAFNQDVPYDQLVREHLAGDLLSTPRINRELGINESAIGPAHLRLVFHGFAPTDALEEKVRFTDDQINVFSKTFLGLTVSCARCHNHKFDPISQADYYALFGVFASCRPATRDVNLPDRQQRHRQSLEDLKGEIRKILGDHWLGSLDRLESRLRQFPAPDQDATATTLIGSQSVLAPWAHASAAVKAGGSFDQAWQQFRQARKSIADQQQSAVSSESIVHQWDFSIPGQANQWYARGNGLQSGPRPAGSILLAGEGNRIVEQILPAGWYTHSLSRRHRGVLESPRVELEGSYDAWLEVIGGGGASLRFVVQDYPRNGTVYPIHRMNRNEWGWHRDDLSYWKGDRVHFELATGPDAPVVTATGEISWFGIRKARLVHQGGPPLSADALEASDWLHRELERSPPQSMEELADGYRRALQSAITSWSGGRGDDRVALFLNDCLRRGLLVNSTVEIPAVSPLLKDFRQLADNLPQPTRVPGVAEADSCDQRFMKRGDHHQLGDPVPRRFLEVFNNEPFETDRSGRRELAEAVLHPDNPLTSRVMVNRIWHHLFGRGIVGTPDNFGLLGEQPTHPELLDYLAQRFVREGWSVKKMIRFLVTSNTWQQSSGASSRAREVDPENLRLSHSRIRRLDAESIRDSLVLASGQLDRTRYGPGEPANSDSRRRAIYLNQYRNNLDSFLQVFDAPVPFATTGRRSVTNVPAQSLALLNNPQVAEWARALGEQIDARRGSERTDVLLGALFLRVMGRTPGADELSWLAEYHESTRASLEVQQQQRLELERDLQQVRGQIQKFVDEFQQRSSHPAKEEKSERPSPIARWNFRHSLDDVIGSLDGLAKGTVRQSSTGVTLDGLGFVITPPIGQTLVARTLEVTVQLASLDQRGGGVMTLQNLSGDQFDSLVFGEQEPRHWLPGSEFFRRTRPVHGPAEDQLEEPLHLVLVHGEDGSVSIYRNGEPYGRPYQTEGSPVRYEKECGQIVFGLRHGTSVTAGRMFSGTIVQAQLYDRALSPSEIAQSAAREGIFSLRRMVDSLSPDARRRWAQLQSEARRLEEKLERYGLPRDPDREAWTRVAHALFNTREFLYIR